MTCKYCIKAIIYSVFTKKSLLIFPIFTQMNDDKKRLKVYYFILFTFPWRFPRQVNNRILYPSFKRRCQIIKIVFKVMAERILPVTNTLVKYDNPILVTLNEDKQVPVHVSRLVKHGCLII